VPRNKLIEIGVSVAKKNFITTQWELAAAVDRSQEHLSAWKNRKVNPSEDMVQRLAKITEIPVVVLVAGSKKVLDKKLKDFFAVQKKMKMMNL